MSSDEEVRLTDTDARSGSQPRWIELKLGEFGIEPIAPRRQISSCFYLCSEHVEFCQR
jgi:hypothetical protein